MRLGLQSSTLKKRPRRTVVSDQRPTELATLMPRSTKASAWSLVARMYPPAYRPSQGQLAAVSCRDWRHPVSHQPARYRCALVPWVNADKRGVLAAKARHRLSPGGSDLLQLRRIIMRWAQADLSGKGGTTASKGPAQRKRAWNRSSRPLISFSFFGAPGRIRTHDPLVRSQVLYPTELRAQRAASYHALRQCRRQRLAGPAPAGATFRWSPAESRQCAGAQPTWR